MILTKEKRKELRGLLINFLNDIYPNPIPKESIYETFYEYWPTKDIDKELAYLVDKEYITEKVLPSPFGRSFDKINNYRLTAHGKDFIDGTIEDFGIQIRR
ncbi:MAG: hypothetical protein ACPKNR_13185 [Pleomorphochaeta sp.]